MSSDPVVQLPVDYTGTAPSNRIRGEQHTLNRTDSRDHRVIIPKLAPFYINQTANNEKIKVSIHNPVTGITTPLIENKDYYPVFFFVTASKSVARPLAGALEILDNTLEGVIHIEYYQALGGVWTLSSQEIAAILADLKYNPRRKSWEQVANLPYAFPPIDHDFNLVDWVGAKDLTDAIYSIRDLMLAGTGSGFEAHVQDKNNPHGTTKAHVLLGLVQNYPVATLLQAERGEGNAYMTPVRTADAIRAQALIPFNAHLAASNPHNITPGLIGAASLAQLALKLDNTGTAANSVKFNGYSFAEAGVEILKGTAFNSDRLGGYTAQEIIGMVGGADVENSLKLGGKTLNEVMESTGDYLLEIAWKAHSSGNADRFGNKTPAEWETDIATYSVANAVKFDSMDRSEHAEWLFGQLPWNLTPAISPVIGRMGLPVVSRYFFSGTNKVFPFFRFSLAGLVEDDFPNDYIGEVTLTFLLTFNGLTQNHVGTYALTVTFFINTTLSTVDDGVPGAMEIRSSTLRSVVGDSDLTPIIYHRKAGNITMELSVDRHYVSEDSGSEYQLADITVMALTGFGQFVMSQERFLTSSVAVESPLHKPTVVESAGSVERTILTATIAPGASATLPVAVTDGLEIYVKDPSTPVGNPEILIPFYPFLSLRRATAQSTLTNDHTAPITYHAYVTK